MSETPTVRVGQVWADCDRRCTGRTVTVLRLTTKRHQGRAVPAAEVRDSRGNTTVIRVDRFRPTSTGYRLVKDVTP